nr:MAG TPA: hypothetical protein [Caudoviricetes sp.]
MFNFLTSFPYLDYIISRYTENVKSFYKVFLKKIRGKKGAKGQNFYIFMVKIICSLFLIYAYLISFLSIIYL